MPSTLPYFLICPICEASLTKSDNSLRCENQHCFDYAKEGYVNLLPPQHKKTKEPGDNKDMIRCRRDFLQKDFYAFLIPELVRIIQNLPGLEDKNETVFLDSGCGEGYFTDRIQTELGESYTYYGMDISKEAARLAAKRNKNIHWFVASSNNIPIQDSSLDILLKINAPLNFTKIKKKLSDNGIVISVSPGENHLAKLRETMYLKPQIHKKEETPADFTLIQQSHVEKEISVPVQRDINNLFKMTPYYWNASSAAQEKVAALTVLNTTASFNINVYQINLTQ